MKTVGEISREYGIPVSTINSAVEAGLLDVDAASGVRQIDDISKKYRAWLDARFQQNRVKRVTEFVRDIAHYAVAHRIQVRGKDVPDRYAILAPLNVLFEILESCPRELDFAQAASVGEIHRLFGCSFQAAEEYVGLFYATLGGAQADPRQVMSLLTRLSLLQSAYLQFFRTAPRNEDRSFTEEMGLQNTEKE